jgi:uncharacterized protein (DUF1330 family)
MGIGFTYTGKGKIGVLFVNWLADCTSMWARKSAQIAECQEGSAMGNFSKIVLGLFFGFVLGLIAAQAIDAQVQPPAYVISEIEVSNPEAYAKEYVPLATKALADSGQRRLASGGRTISISGAPPASRIVVSMFENLEKAKAAYTSHAYLEARKIGDKFGKLRIYAVEGVAAK